MASITKPSSLEARLYAPDGIVPDSSEFLDADSGSLHGLVHGKFIRNQHGKRAEAEAEDAATPTAAVAGEIQAPSPTDLNLHIDVEKFTGYDLLGALPVDRDQQTIFAGPATSTAIAGPLALPHASNTLPCPGHKTLSDGWHPLWTLWFYAAALCIIVLLNYKGLTAGSSRDSSSTSSDETEKDTEALELEVDAVDSKSKDLVVPHDDEDGKQSSCLDPALPSEALFVDLSEMSSDCGYCRTGCFQQGF